MKGCVDRLTDGARRSLAYSAHCPVSLLPSKVSINLKQVRDAISVQNALDAVLGRMHISHSIDCPGALDVTHHTQSCAFISTGVSYRLLPVAQLFSEHDEGLSDVTLDSLLLDSDDVESDSLGEGSALTDGHDITDSGTGEGGRQMSGHVVMSLLESVVLLDVMKVISAEDDGSRHLVGENDTPKEQIGLD